MFRFIMAAPFIWREAWLGSSQLPTQYLRHSLHSKALLLPYSKTLEKEKPAGFEQATTTAKNFARPPKTASDTPIVRLLQSMRKMRRVVLLTQNPYSPFKQLHGKELYNN